MRRGNYTVASKEALKNHAEIMSNLLNLSNENQTGCKLRFRGTEDKVVYKTTKLWMKVSRHTHINGSLGRERCVGSNTD